MNNPLRVGDPVTIVSAGVHHGEVTTLAEYGIHVVAHYFEFARHASTEGLTWLRGHHAVDSAEVKALLVAQALQGYSSWP